MKMQVKNLLYAIIFIALYFNIPIDNYAQNVIDETEKKQLLDSLSSLIDKNYVYSEIGKQISNVLKANLNKGKYKEIVNPLIFAKELTEDIRSVNNDKHLSVRFDPISINRYLQSIKFDDNSFDDFEDEISSYNNHQFNELKILKGNVGYLKLTGFSDRKNAQKTAKATFDFLSNTDAIIIDLRENRGGSPSMVQLLVSYFLNGESIHLSTIYNRPSGEYQQIWSLPFVQGSVISKKDLFILIGERTFSAAEGFTYVLKHLNRATLVGEKTDGAAHLVDRFPLNKNFYIQLSTGRGINKLTNTNWEGKGITPHIKIDESLALEKAHFEILIKLNKLKQESYKNVAYNWEIERLNAILNPIKLGKSDVKNCTGKFDDRIITSVRGELFYQNGDNIPMKMIPITSDYFMFKEKPNFRIEIIKDDQRAIAVQGHYENGSSDWNDRTN